MGPCGGYPGPCGPGMPGPQGLYPRNDSVWTDGTSFGGPTGRSFYPSSTFLSQGTSFDDSFYMGGPAYIPPNYPFAPPAAPPGYQQPGSWSDVPVPPALTGYGPPQQPQQQAPTAPAPVLAAPPPLMPTAPAPPPVVMMPPASFVAPPQVASYVAPPTTVSRPGSYVPPPATTAVAMTPRAPLPVAAPVVVAAPQRPIAVAAPQRPIAVASQPAARPAQRYSAQDLEPRVIPVTPAPERAGLARRDAELVRELNAPLVSSTAGAVRRPLGMSPYPVGEERWARSPYNDPLSISSRSLPRERSLPRFVEDSRPLDRGFPRDTVTREPRRVPASEILRGGDDPLSRSRPRVLDRGEPYRDPVSSSRDPTDLFNRLNDRGSRSYEPDRVPDRFRAPSIDRAPAVDRSYAPTYGETYAENLDRNVDRYGESTVGTLDRGAA